jgi:hypothetical protein
MTDKAYLLCCSASRRGAGWQLFAAAPAHRRGNTEWLEEKGEGFLAGSRCAAGREAWRSAN